MRPKTYTPLKRQHGLSYAGVLLIMSVAIFIGMFAFKVGPHYFEHWTVAKIAAELAEKPEVLKQSRSKVYKHINQAYQFNNLWGLKAEDTIVLTRDSNRGYVITVQYERRDTLFRNIDVVTRFDSSTDVDTSVADKK